MCRATAVALALVSPSLADVSITTAPSYGLGNFFSVNVADLASVHVDERAPPAFNFARARV